MNYAHRKNQSGVVLVISLIMLLLLTIIGVTAMQVNNLEEKMAGNARDQNIAFQAAESTLQEAESFILNNPNSDVTYSGANGLLDIADDEPTNFFTHSWSAADSTAAPNNYGLTEDPRYIIKRISGPIAGATADDPDRTYFKITARATGASAGTQIILQAHFVRYD